MAKDRGGLSTPMTGMFPQPPKGAREGGDKEGWKPMNDLGAPRPSVDEPSLQITQDIVGSMDGRTMGFPPRGTANPDSGKK